jgi:hypothetical protein
VIVTFFNLRSSHVTNLPIDTAVQVHLVSTEKYIEQSP